MEEETDLLGSPSGFVERIDLEGHVLEVSKIYGMAPDLLDDMQLIAEFA
jgi:hypothetical protein